MREDAAAVNLKREFLKPKKSLISFENEVLFYQDNNSE